ncbi:hypothetical protein AX15_006480 [Amanita polypyramis BW_CC]|nr:hypothetical protein AX15_006480 [Amanita polypyramis BW_CC]
MLGRYREFRSQYPISSSFSYPRLAMEFRSPLPFHSHIPDSLTIPQFIFNCPNHPDRPTRDHANVPWFIDNDTGRPVFEDEVRRKTYTLARGIKEKYTFGENDVALIFSRNHIDYPTVMWAVHMLGGIISGANPDFSPSELAHQITETKASILFVHYSPDALDAVLKSAQITNISMDRMILFDAPHLHPTTGGATKFTTVSNLVQLGIENWNKPSPERHLSPGEARTKLAYLSFSSGTTGKPKAVAVPHYAVIANVLQMAVHNKINDREYWERKGEKGRFVPGDVGIAVLPFYRKSFFHCRSSGNLNANADMKIFTV